MKIYRKKFGQYSGRACFCLFLFSWCFLLSAYGVVDSSLYQGETPVASYLPADWQKAVVTALQQVLVKVSGNPNVAQDAVIRKTIAKPNPLVQSYNYVADSGEKALVLQVRFSPKAIDRLLQNINQSHMTTENTVGDAAMASAATDVLPTSASSQNAALQSAHAINMVVSGINGLQDYTVVLDYLRHVDGVIDVSSKQTQGNRILLVLKISKTVDDLTQAIANEHKLVKGNSTNPSVLMYRWVTNVSAVTPTTMGTVNQPLSISTVEQPARRTSSGVAPIVEGVPVTPLSVSKAATSDSGQAQSFAVPTSDSIF